MIHTECRGAPYTQARKGLLHVVLPTRSLAGVIGSVEQMLPSPKQIRPHNNT